MKNGKWLLEYLKTEVEMLLEDVHHKSLPFLQPRLPFLDLNQVCWRLVQPPLLNRIGSECVPGGGTSFLGALFCFCFCHQDKSGKMDTSIIFRVLYLTLQKITAIVFFLVAIFSYFKNLFF